MKKFALLLIVVLLLAGTVLTVSADPRTGGDAGRPVAVELSGANEVSNTGVVGVGDPDGSGLAEITFNQGLGLVCWRIHYSNIATPTAAHIHVGVAGANGPVVVPLLPVDGGCVSVSRELIQALRRNPSGYYVNVHNAEYPGGAIRGQLG